MIGFKSLLSVGRRDTPLENDSGDALEIAPYARGLEHFICTCETPMTMGIQGEWGSGKTSLMRLIETRLTPSPGSKATDRQAQVMTFWFETWQYGAVGHADQLGLLLMRDLASRLLGQLKEDDASYRYLQDMKSFLQRAAPAVAAGAISTATAGVVDGGTLVGSLSPGGGGATQDMRRSFGKLVAHALKRAKKERLIVFIDDLDRIPPRLAVRLLEVLKNFMDVPQCIFVVACDYDVVREGVTELMGLDGRAGDHKVRQKVDAFFHKIFQVPFHMPTGSYSVNSLFERYVRKKLLDENDGIGDNKRGKDGLTAAELAVNAFLHEMHGANTSDWFPLLSATVEGALGTNPRAFKRYLNVVDLTCCVDAAFAGGGAQRDGATPAQAAATASLAHWSIRGPEAKRATMRWLLTLFPVVALQQRWPEFAPHLLSGVTSQFSLEIEGQAPLRMTLFERRLRTLTQQWPDRVATEDYIQHLEDEFIREVLAEQYGDDGRDRGHPEIQRLERFCRSWYRLLNNSADQDRLTRDELGKLQAWSERLGRMGANQSEPRGIAAFQKACQQEDPKAGDGFAALSSLVLHTLKSRDLDHLLAESKKPEEFRVYGRTASRSYTVLMVLMARNGSLQLKLNATEEVARKKGIDGLDTAAAALLDAWRTQAGLSEAHLDEKPQSVYIQYDQWHTPARARAARDPMIAFLNAADDAFRAASAAAATTTTVAPGTIDPMQPSEVDVQPAGDPTEAS